jgi:hypothetical protein
LESPTDRVLRQNRTVVRLLRATDLRSRDAGVVIGGSTLLSTDRPFGTARRNGPWNIPSMLPLDIGTPNNGGAAVTAGGLIFIAAATDNLFRAIDIETGETVGRMSCRPVVKPIRWSMRSTDGSTW